MLILGSQLVPLAIGLALVVSVLASLPEDLSNFQNHYVCDTAVRLVRPRSTVDVQKAVKRHARLQACGNGCTWNMFYCAPSPDETEPDNGATANIVTTTIRPLRINIDEEDMSVWVSAGVTVWDLMVYLGSYVTPLASRGYALGANSGFVNQTIGGAVATGTHGSSLTYGSLSNQVIGFRVVLANGTTTVIEPDSYPFYFRAFQVHVGRLGVVTDVKMRIIKENLVRRTLQIGVPGSELMSMFFEAQEMYRSTGTLPSWLNTMALNYRQTDSTFLIQRVEDIESDPDEHEESTTNDDLMNESESFRETYLAETINAPLNVSRSEPGFSVSNGVEWEVPLPLAPNLAYQDANNTAAFLAGTEDAFLADLNNATIERHEAAVQSLTFLAGALVTPFDEYELAVPVNKMADCLDGLLDLLHSMSPDDGLRIGVLVSFIGQDTGLLSVSHDMPHMYVALPDFVYYNQETRQPNLPHRRLMAYMVTSPLCSPVRLHWGCAGRPDPGCWNAAELYPDTWCDFGCAVRALDPENKFIGAVPEVWNWNGANLDLCCTEDGYDTSLDGCGCSVIPVRTPEECPEAPFYTTR